MGPDRSVVVVGAGAVGGYLGGKLAAVGSGARVTLVARQPVVDAVTDHGLIIREASGECVVRPRVAASAEGLPPADLIVLTVRTYDVESALPDIHHLMGPNSHVIAMQNGVGSEEVVGSALGRDRVIVGTMTAAVRAEAPGTVERVSTGGGLALASMEGKMSESVQELFQSSGLATLVVNDYRSLRWSKLLLNMLGAATSSILDMNLSEIVANRATFGIEQRAFAEAARVMDALRIEAISLPGYPVPLTRSIMRLPLGLPRLLVGRRLARSRGGRSPAMRSDLQRGKTEVRSLNGAVADAARSLGMEAPVNRALTGLIEELTSNPRRRGEFRGKPAALVGYLRENGVKV